MSGRSRVLVRHKIDGRTWFARINQLNSEGRRGNRHHGGLVEVFNQKDDRKPFDEFKREELEVVALTEIGV